MQSTTEQKPRAYILDNKKWQDFDPFAFMECNVIVYDMSTEMILWLS